MTDAPTTRAPTPDAPLIAVNGARLSAALEGPGRAPVVVFAHPLGGTRAVWDLVAPALRGRYRVLRYDARGHGASPAVPGPLSVDDLADDLAGLLDHFGVERAHVVGLSLGGMTGQALASRRPSLVASLTLIATSAHLPSAKSWAERAAAARRDGPGSLGDAVMARWFTPGYEAREPARVAALRAGLAACDPEGYALACEAIGAMDLRGRLGAIRAPTLVIAGAQDPSTPPAMARELAEGVPDAELVVLPRAAHVPAVERPDAVAAHLLAFLERHRGPPAPARAPTTEEGLANRRAVLGEAHVARSLAGAGAFAGPWQDFIARTAWGEVWGDPALPWKTRSLIVLAVTLALGREEEFKLHLAPALGNGVTVPELRALLTQVAVYAGVPAANAGFRWAREALGERLEAEG